MPDDSPRSIGIALALGAASSSCSYAAVAIARSIFRKGANFSAAMAFEMASTNLVLELSIILIVLMGCHFMVAEAIAAPIMVAILVLLFRMFLRPQLVTRQKTRRRKALRDAWRGTPRWTCRFLLKVRYGSGSSRTRVSPRSANTSSWTGCSLDGYRRRSRDRRCNCRLGPARFLEGVFLTDHPILATLWGPLVGPLVAIIAFVCSVGNIPLAAVLWNGGIASAACSPSSSQT